MPTIYCDEAGNSGANLLDRDQPFFVLASNDFSRDEAVALLEHVKSPQGAEPKFTALKKSGAGVAKLIRFLSDPRLNENRVVADVFDKRFMIVTKMVDLIAETLVHRIGGDLYERGANIAMSNMLHYCMPVFCREENTDRFLQSFVELVRQREEAQISAFYDAGKAMVEASTNEKFKEDLMYFTEPRLFSLWFSEEITPQALDPAIPALFGHIATWGARKDERFEVVHDSSKPILASQATFTNMMALSHEESVLVGYDRRKFRFPLRATSLSQADSREHPQLQVADLCAGLINHFNKCNLVGELDDLAIATRELRRLDWVFDAVIPTTDVTPEALGTEEVGGINPVDGVIDYLLQRTTRTE